VVVVGRFLAFLKSVAGATERAVWRVVRTALLTPWSVVVLFFWIALLIFQVVTIVLAKILRMILHPWRYFFFAVGQFGLTNVFTTRGRAKLRRDAR
jgi:hypothetical protein